jgi:hypothetical protein
MRGMIKAFAVAAAITDPNFSTLVVTATTGPKVTSATLSGLADGTYYWRVQSVSFPPSRTSRCSATGPRPGP